jgi:omega-amidase
MPKLTISLAQMNIALGDSRKNLQQFEAYTSEAARRGSRLVLFPELWASGYALENAREMSAALNAGEFAAVSTAATQHKISIVGSLLEKRGIEVSNSATFFAPTGKLVGVYRKIHLFKLMDEHRWLQAGAAPLLMDLPWGKTGIAI